MDDCTFDVAITSPPYNLRNSSGNGMKDGRGGKWSNASLLNGYHDYQDNMPHSLYVDWQRECLTQMLRVIKEGGAIFYNHKWRVQRGKLQDRSDIVEGFNVRQVIIWQRKGGINFNKGYFLPTYEVIYMITKGDFFLKEGANKYGDVWSITQDRNNPHPAPFPVELPTRILKSCNGSRVLDPFVGSGSTAVAAKSLGWECCGIDRSEEYIKQSLSRLDSNLSLNKKFT